MLGLLPRVGNHGLQDAEENRSQSTSTKGTSAWAIPEAEVHCFSVMARSPDAHLSPIRFADAVGTDLSDTK